MASASEATELVKEEQGEPGAVPARPEDLEGFTGYDTLDPDAFVIPRLKIVQPTSKDGTPGTFRMNLTGEEFHEMHILVVKAEQGRVMWDRENDADEPACRSYDGHVPDPSIEAPPSPVCVEEVAAKGGKLMVRPKCPMAVWGQDGERPACDSVYNLLCLSTDESLPFWLTVSGTSIGVFKRYVSGIALRRRKLFEFSTTISLEETTNKKGKFFVLAFSPPKRLSDEDLEAMSEVVAGIRNESVQRTYEAEAAGDESGESGNGTEGVQAPDWAE